VAKKKASDHPIEEAPLFDVMGQDMEVGTTHDEHKKANLAHGIKADPNPLNQPDLWGRTKEDTAIQRLREYEPPEGYYVAFSGGKDSIVCLDLVIKSGVKYDAHFRVMGGIDPPEVIHYIREHWGPKGVSIDQPINPWSDDEGKVLTMWDLIV